jgi:hypothetical protein
MLQDRANNHLRTAGAVTLRNKRAVLFRDANRAAVLRYAEPTRRVTAVFPSARGPHRCGPGRHQGPASRGLTRYAMSAVRRLSLPARVVESALVSRSRVAVLLTRSPTRHMSSLRSGNPSSAAPISRPAAPCPG